MTMSAIMTRISELGGLFPCIGPSSSGRITPLSEEKISELESELEVTLPDDYRRFLSQYGACRFRSIVSSHPKLYYRIASFYGGSDNEITDAIFEFEGRMPESLLPIAECDDGAICLGIGEDNFGKIFYWDRENEWDWKQQDQKSSGNELSKEELFQNVTEISDSFEALFFILQIVEADE